MYWIYGLLVAHFIGDFVLQSDEMAKNKSKSNWMLLCHVSVYLIPLVLVSALIQKDSAFVFIFILVNGIANFLVDWITSRINSILWNRKEVHNFFVGIGADQLAHYSTLMYTAHLFLGK